MDKLIERELLAQEAERLGYVVTDEEVEDLVADSKMIGLGYPVTVSRVQKDGKFNYDSFKNFVQYELGLTPQELHRRAEARAAGRARARPDARRRQGVAGRGEGRLRAQGAAGQPRVRALLHPQVRAGGGDQRRRDGRLRREERGQAAGALRAEEVRLREGAQRAPLRQILVKVGATATRKRESTRPRASRKAEPAGGQAQRRARPFAAGGQGVVRRRSEQGARAASSAGARTGPLGLPSRRDEDKVYAAKTASVVGPFKSKDGYGLLVAEGNREGNMPFDKVKLELAEEKICAKSALARWPRPTPRPRWPSAKAERRQVAEGAVPGQGRRQSPTARATTRPRRSCAKLPALR